MDSPPQDLLSDTTFHPWKTFHLRCNVSSAIITMPAQWLSFASSISGEYKPTLPRYPSGLLEWLLTSDTEQLRPGDPKVNSFVLIQSTWGDQSWHSHEGCIPEFLENQAIPRLFVDLLHFFQEVTIQYSDSKFKLNKTFFYLLRERKEEKWIRHP